jgi:hypothetical protein
VASERRLGRFGYAAAIAGVLAIVGAAALLYGPARTSPARYATGEMVTTTASASGSASSVAAIEPSISAPATGLTPTIDPSQAAPAPKATPPPPAPTATVARPRPTPVPPAPTQPPSGWVTVVKDQFNSSALPARWQSYDGPYGSGPHNCAIPSHAVVSGGYLHLLMGYESSGPCGAGWYTAGLVLKGYSSVDQRVTVRFRIVDSGVAGHFIVPMRWPDDGVSWPAGGEEDFCESDTSAGCTTFLHYSSSNRQNQHSYSVDLSQWHTLRFQRLDHVVSAFIDDMATPTWTFSGDSKTLPDTLKHVVLQQECQSSCPAGTTGSEDIQIDWITVDNPA